MGLPLFDIKDPASVMFELKEAQVMCSWLHPLTHLMQVTVQKVVVMSFIVNRPANEPGFYLERGEGPGRMIRYTIKSCVQANPEGGRY
jgi:ribulose-bisphosphate carboxylase small chain